MHFFHSIWKNLHLTEKFYTDMSVVSVTNMRYGKRLTGQWFDVFIYTSHREYHPYEITLTLGTSPPTSDIWCVHLSCGICHVVIFLLGLSLLGIYIHTGSITWNLVLIRCFPVLYFKTWILLLDLQDCLVDTGYQR